MVNILRNSLLSIMMLTRVVKIFPYQREQIPTKISQRKLVFLVIKLSRDRCNKERMSINSPFNIEITIASDTVVIYIFEIKPIEFTLFLFSKATKLP